MKPFEPTGFAERLAKTEQLLATAVVRYRNIVFASSLGAEDVVLTDLIWQNYPQIGIFTLDTGRLNPETYKLMARMEQRYARRMAVYFPRSRAIAPGEDERSGRWWWEQAETRECGLHHHKEVA